MRSLINSGPQCDLDRSGNLGELVGLFLYSHGINGSTKSNLGGLHWNEESTQVCYLEVNPSLTQVASQF